MSSSQRQSVDAVSESECALLRQSARNFLARAWPVAKAVENSNDAEAVAKLWLGFAGQGLASLGSDAAEAGLREIILVFEELGRASCPAPLLGAITANLALAAQSSDSGRDLLEDLHQGRAIVAAGFGAYDGDLAAGHVTPRSDTLHGSLSFKAQQDEWLPAIRRGDRTFALGYSEPEAGSDLAALRTCAVRDGDDWIVNGQKLWSTGADKAEYIWLAVRTDPEAKKHAGISVLMVDLRSPGITLRPSVALYGKTFSAQFYDNVRVPSKNMVGAVNDGWRVITDALASERVMIGATRMAGIERAFDHLTEYLKTAMVGGKMLKNDPVIRDRIGALAADIEVAWLFQMRNARLIEQGKVPLHEAAMGKVFASELQERLGQAALDILGASGLLSEDAEGAPVGEMEYVLRHAIMGMIGGGTNEIQRNVIAQRGLELPR